MGDETMWTRFERRFWESMTERKAERIGYAALIVWFAAVGCGVTAAAAWLLSLE
jgi:hypothetical protein